MAHAPAQDGSGRRLAARLANAFLWPGNIVCRLLRVRDPDSVMLLRMFVNLTVYAKIAVLGAYLVT